MRKLLIGAGVMVVVLIVAAVLVPLLVPASVYRDRLVDAVQSATGRQLHINGPVKLSLLPNLAIEASDVALDNAPGGSAQEMATLAKLEVAVKILPLLSGDIEITRFVLTDPVIHLEVDKTGRPNWEFAPAAAQKTDVSPKPAEAARHKNSLQELRLGEVELINGTVDYFDARTDTRYAADQIGVTIGLPGLDEKSTFDGSVTWRGKPIKVAIAVDRPRAFMRGSRGGGSSKLTLGVSSDLFNLAFDGTETAGKPSSLEGMLSVDATSVRGVATLAGTPPRVGGDGLGSFSLRGKLVSAGPLASFSDIALKLDAIQAGGDIAIDGSGAVPAIKGALTVGTLDVNPYLARPDKARSSAPGAPGPQVAAPQSASPEVAAPEVAAPVAATPGAATPQAAPPPPPAGSSQWSDTPIDFSALKSVDADLTIAAAGLRYEKVEIGKSALAVALHGGRLNLGLTQLQAYGGSGKGQVVVDGSGAVPGLNLSFTLNGVQAQPLLAAAIGFDRLSGTGQLSFDVASQGPSQRAMIGALSGKGSFGFADGAIKGVDLNAMMKNLEQAVLQVATGGAQQTNFADLSGSFTVANGILRNDDLLMKTPVAQLHGAGTIDLPDKSLDYRVEPDLSVNSQEISVPVKITGPWDKPSYRPDVKGLVTQNAGKLLQGVLGKGPNSNGSKPADLLKGLLGK